VASTGSTCSRIGGDFCSFGTNGSTPALPAAGTDQMPGILRSERLARPPNTISGFCIAGKDESDRHRAWPLQFVPSGSGPSFAEVRRTGRRASTSVDDGRLPLHLSDDQSRGHDAGSLVEIVQGGSGPPFAGSARTASELTPSNQLRITSPANDSEWSLSQSRRSGRLAEAVLERCRDSSSRKRFSERVTLRLSHRFQ
jgi:hypothetical protein